MANKYLRKLMRSRLLFFTSTRAHQANATAAQPVQGLSNYDTQGAPIRSVRASHSSCLPLQASLCLPSSSATYSPPDEGEYTSAHVEGEEEEQQLERCDSCSKLQGKQLVPSFKSLLHRASSHSHLHDNRHRQSSKLHDFAAESSTVSKYTRSSSAPSLHIGRHILKLPHKARSFSSSQGSRGKRAPKGHVAVYVEAGRERHVVPIEYLSHPQFQALLERAKSEFGFSQKGPGLLIPCSLSELHHTLHQINNHHTH